MSSEGTNNRFCRLDETIRMTNNFEYIKYCWQGVRDMVVSFPKKSLRLGESKSGLSRYPAATIHKKCLSFMPWMPHYAQKLFPGSYDTRMESARNFLGLDDDLSELISFILNTFNCSKNKRKPQCMGDIMAQVLKY